MREKHSREREKKLMAKDRTSEASGSTLKWSGSIGKALWMQARQKSSSKWGDSVWQMVVRPRPRAVTTTVQTLRSLLSVVCMNVATAVLVVVFPSCLCGSLRVTAGLRWSSQILIWWANYICWCWLRPNSHILSLVASTCQREMNKIRDAAGAARTTQQNMNARSYEYKTSRPSLF